MTPQGAPALPDHELPASQPTVLQTRAEAEAYVASVCFKHGPPRLVGVELEWLLHRPSAPAAALDVGTLAAALGPHAPPSITPAAPARPLPEGAEVTVEPGGQVEIASRPHAGLAGLVAAVRADAAALLSRLAAHGLVPLSRAADPLRPPRRLLAVPRYQAMERHFDRVGPAGRSMMCSTAAVQVCLDAGDGPAVAQRWRALHMLGPVLLGAFANSPRLHGRRTGWKSSRWACWLALDPPRTAPPESLDGDPAAAYARRAVDTALLCLPRAGDCWDAPAGATFAAWVDGGLADVAGRPPTTVDLDYHLSTLFPPVRPRGHVEVRYLDAQPGGDWTVPVAALAALLARPETVDAVLAACEPAAGRWVAAARHGLADEVVARAARAVFALACAALPALDPPPDVRTRLEEFTEQRVGRARCPADDPAPAPVVGSVAVPVPLEGADR